MYTMERTKVLLITILQSSLAAAVIDPRYYNTNQQADPYGRLELAVPEEDRTFPGVFVLQQQQQQQQPYGGAAASFSGWTPIVQAIPRDVAPTADDYDAVTFAPPPPTPSTQSTAAVAFVTPLRPAAADGDGPDARRNGADGRPDRVRRRHRPQGPQQAAYDVGHAAAGPQRDGTPPSPRPQPDGGRQDFEDRFRDNYLQFVNHGQADDGDRAKGPRAQHEPTATDARHRDAGRDKGATAAGRKGQDENINSSNNNNKNNNNNKKRPVQRVRDQVRIIDDDGRSDAQAAAVVQPKKSRPNHHHPHGRNDFATTDAAQKTRWRDDGGSEDERRQVVGHGRTAAVAGAGAGATNGGQHPVRGAESPAAPGQRRRKVHRTRRPRPPAAVVENAVDGDAAGLPQQPPSSAADGGQNGPDRVSYVSSSRDDQRRQYGPTTSLAVDDDDDNDDDGDNDAAGEEQSGGYGFGYAVLDESSGTDFGQWERREPGRSGTVTGQYRVRLPDGRTQTVEYNAGSGTGYRASVTYEGVQIHPEPRPAQAIFSPSDSEDVADEPSSE